jgi:hypothetical protein
MDVKLTPTVLFRAISAVAACIGPNCEGAMMRAATAASDASGTLLPTDADLRDYFAAKMIAALWLEASDVECDDRFARAEALSMQAYEIADAMLAARCAK